MIDWLLETCTKSTSFTGSAVLVLRNDWQPAYLDFHCIYLLPENAWCSLAPRARRTHQGPWYTIPFSMPLAAVCYHWCRLMFRVYRYRLLGICHWKNLKITCLNFPSYDQNLRVILCTFYNLLSLLIKCYWYGHYCYLSDSHCLPLKLH